MVQIYMDEGIGGSSGSSSEVSAPDVANLVPGLLAGFPYRLHPFLHQLLELLGPLLHLLLEARHGACSQER
ncbi:hypothetical protein MUK42_14140 [Musa troglodytarum]|uniref:Uncharacterized protein n=1 Tax=Musa troglodytarum TaxID=320322 RepID=A0A9E7FKQ0_9LILI|nr:hypothetical protein MUK42_14140 [Musa troglodytarum]